MRVAWLWMLLPSPSIVPLSLSLLLSVLAFFSVCLLGWRVLRGLALVEHG